ncbi:MAG: cytochrome c [Gemmatimonadetes bacterium]|nr:cytochrome c [Gemmatimonadota bacterium]MBI3567963.1 cytochrome c [Gemmatimonadota bacterium]
MRVRLFAVAMLAAAAPVVAAAQQDRASDGKTTFETVCVVCHSVTPPPKLAPPMMMVSRHYRFAFATEREASDAMLRYVLAPDSLRSAMPSHVIQRFGVMPKPPVNDAQARAAVRYVLSLSAPPPVPGMTK